MSVWMIKFPTYDKSAMRIHKGTLAASKLPFSRQQKGAQQGSLLYGVLGNPQETCRGRSRGGGLVFVEGVAIKARREASGEREKIKEPLRRT